MSQSFVGPSLAPIIWNQCFLSDFICLSNLNTVEEDCGYSFMDNISIRLWYGFWLDHCNTLISCCILDHCPVGLMDHCKVITSCGCKTSQILTPPPLCCLCLRSLCWYGAWCWPNMQHQAPYEQIWPIWSCLPKGHVLLQKLCVQVQISLPDVFL